MPNPKLNVKTQKSYGSKAQPGTYTLTLDRIEPLGEQQWDPKIPPREMAEFHFTAHGAGEGGNDEPITYGCAMTTATGRGKESNLTKLIRALNGSVPTSEFNLEFLLGKQCRGVIDLVPDSKQRYWSKIIAFLPLTAQPAQATSRVSVEQATQSYTIPAPVASEVCQ